MAGGITGANVSAHPTEPITTENAAARATFDLTENMDKAGAW